MPYLIFSSYYGIINFNKLDKSSKKGVFFVTNTSLDILKDAFGKVKFSELSIKELSEIQDFLDKKDAEIKFVQRTKRKRI